MSDVEDKATIESLRSQVDALTKRLSDVEEDLSSLRCGVASNGKHEIKEAVMLYPELGMGVAVSPMGVCCAKCKMRLDVDAVSYKEHTFHVDANSHNITA